MEKYLKVGKISSIYGKEVLVEREFYRQGLIFKDEEAYRCRPDAVCYVPELSDATYTAKDFLELCNGQQEFADELFDEVDWQHPESLLEDLMVNSEWVICPGCGRLVDYDNEANDTICPGCGTAIEE